MRGKFVTFDFVNMLHIKQSENESVNSPHTSDWCAYTYTSKTNQKKRTNTQWIWKKWLFCSWVQVEKIKTTANMKKNRDMKTQSRKNRICSVSQQNTADYLLNSEDKGISHQSKWCLHWLSLPPRNHSELRLYFSRCHFCSIQWLAERPLGEDETHFKKMRLVEQDGGKKHWSRKRPALSDFHTKMIGKIKTINSLSSWDHGYSCLENKGRRGRVLTE